jgi:hypothetical protein
LFFSCLRTLGARRYRGMLPGSLNKSVLGFDGGELARLWSARGSCRGLEADGEEDNPVLVVHSRVLELVRTTTGWGGRSMRSVCWMGMGT